MKTPAVLPHQSIAAKALSALVLMVVVVSVVSGYNSLKGSRQLLTGEFTERGFVLARNLAFNAGYGVYTRDQISLSQLLDGVMEEPNVLFAVIADGDGRVLASSARTGYETTLAAHREGLSASGEEGESVREMDGGSEPFLLLTTPVMTREFVISDPEAEEWELLSLLDAGLSPEARLETTRVERHVLRGRIYLALSRAKIENGMAAVTRDVALLTLIVIIIGTAISAALVRLFLEPLHRLTQVTAQVAAGDLNAKVQTRGTDELAMLGHSFNSMTDALRLRDDEIRRTQEGLATANRELADLNGHLEERVARRTLDLEATNRELIAATRRKSEFMANLAHELRTPLNSVIGFSEALRDGLLGELGERQLKYVNNIVTSGRHILEMSGGILDLSRIEAGTIDVRLEPLDVVQALEEIITITEPQRTARGLSVALECDALERSRTHLADRGKFKQVLYNLVSNAIKFSPENGSLELACHTDADFLELRVRDHGPGIPEAHREEVFEEFRQLPDGEAAGGSGLGLSITRKLVELHGGRIWVEETAGGGATFVVRLPENPPPQPGAAGRA
ncbi:MAG: HAMP domain-containing histidine kinase [Nitrospirota bacterium]|nr:HAMP domain-containing histidine kinase [Nitrospirota bacterium]